MSTDGLALEDSRLILSLQLWLARAGQKDSLAWWEAESLTSSGEYVLGRLFPAIPTLAGRQLALAAARARHENAFADDPDALHLFRLDKAGEIVYALSAINLAELELPLTPVKSMAALHEALQGLSNQPASLPEIIHELPGRRLQVRVAPVAGEAILVTLARALAWAYMNGQPSVPIFPFIRS